MKSCTGDVRQVANKGSLEGVTLASCTTVEASLRSTATLQVRCLRLKNQLGKCRRQFFDITPIAAKSNDAFPKQFHAPA